MLLSRETLYQKEQQQNTKNKCVGFSLIQYILNTVSPPFAPLVSPTFFIPQHNLPPSPFSSSAMISCETSHPLGFHLVSCIGNSDSELPCELINYLNHYHFYKNIAASALGLLTEPNEAVSFLVCTPSRRTRQTFKALTVFNLNDSF